MALRHSRRSKGVPKRERTRRLLVESAAELIAIQGYEKTSLEAVAARVGMSRGAIYGNFANRAALFMAVAETCWRPIAPSFESGSGLAERMRRLGDAVAVEAERRQRMAVGAVSFHLYALKEPELRKRLVEANEAQYRAATERLLADFPAEQLPVPADAFVKSIHALIEGLLLTHALTPTLVTSDVIRSAFELLASATTSQ